MRIYTVSFMSHRLQMAAMLHERMTSTLTSFAFHRDVAKKWEAYWTAMEMMRRGAFRAARDHIKDSMEGFLGPGDWDDVVKHRDRPSKDSHTMVDSGAFTAWKIGAKFTVDEYAEWLLQFDAEYRHRFTSLHFVSLDVIRDQTATWQNYERLRRDYNAPVMPVVTLYDAKLTDIDRALEESDFICFGGMPKGKTEILRYLDPAWSHVWKWADKHGKMPRVHMLGVTKDWMLERYPAFSSDSSTWCDVTRFGRALALKLQLPRAGKTDPKSVQRVAQLHSLRIELRKFRDMASRMTDLWRMRGVEFGEDS